MPDKHNIKHFIYDGTLYDGSAMVIPSPGTMTLMWASTSHFGHSCGTGTRVRYPVPYPANGTVLWGSGRARDSRRFVVFPDGESLVPRARLPAYGGTNPAKGGANSHVQWDTGS